MVFDLIANTSIPTAASNSKDFGKKKRVNRTAKLKQSKLDVRRAQWLSQVKNRGFKEETNATRVTKMPAPETHAEDPHPHPIVKLEISVCGKGNESLMMNNYSDSESPSNSPTSHTSSVCESNISVTNFIGSSSRSSCGSSSSSGDCCSGSMTDEDDADDDMEPTRR